MKDVRVRFAPSPTGALHLGNARTFLVNWALARQNGWRVLLRIEDLDTPRVKPETIEQTRDILRWLGLTWLGRHPSFMITFTIVVTLWSVVSLTVMGVRAARRGAAGNSATKSRKDGYSNGSSNGSYGKLDDTVRRERDLIAPSPFVVAHAHELLVVDVLNI